LGAFDKVAESENESVRIFGFYHKALALASAGDFEGAAHILSGEAGMVLRLPRRGIVAYVEVLSQLERNGDALDLIAKSQNSALADPYLADLSARLEAGETIPFSSGRSAKDGLAEVCHSIASALRQEPQRNYTLLYARMATILRPDHIDALLLTAELLEKLDQHDLATEVYDKVPRDDPEFHAAELGRAETLRQSGRENAAIEVLQQLTESHGHLLQVHVALADMLRELDRFEEAKAPYNNAIAMIREPVEQHWIIYFARGIAYERTGHWSQAEADFRKALELKPDQPTVLNYLGYSLLELQTNLDEALALIERAVEQRPDAGHIIDSLGWGLYRLGRYEEAVTHMERAAEHLPIDPIVNDHLGDVYWAVGRHREAEFQWHRALSLITDKTDHNDVDPERIRRKLEIGLDAVLAEEGAPPLNMANDDG
ncbi:MAG: tetratricopeptide repeat protein, partial [Boseongicola sp.]|nr:tetratricopeptide repeat protein [Boseongicola sp.]